MGAEFQRIYQLYDSDRAKASTFRSCVMKRKLGAFRLTNNAFVSLFFRTKSTDNSRLVVSALVRDCTSQSSLSVNFTLRVSQPLQQSLRPSHGTFES